MACTEPGPHHSTDLVSVYTGLADPTVMCGYHASKRHPPPVPRLPAPVRPIRNSRPKGLDTSS